MTATPPTSASTREPETVEARITRFFNDTAGRLPDDNKALHLIILNAQIIIDQLAAERDEARLLQIPADHDKPCHACGEPTNSLHGNPGLWPIMLEHNQFWHRSCLIAEREKDKADLETYERKIRWYAPMLESTRTQLAAKDKLLAMALENMSTISDYSGSYIPHIALQKIAFIAQQTLAELLGVSTPANGPGSYEEPFDSIDDALAALKQDTRKEIL